MLAAGAPGPTISSKLSSSCGVLHIKTQLHVTQYLGKSEPPFHPQVWLWNAYDWKMAWLVICFGSFTTGISRSGTLQWSSSAKGWLLLQADWICCLLGFCRGAMNLLTMLNMYRVASSTSGWVLFFVFCSNCNIRQHASAVACSASMIQAVVWELASSAPSDPFFRRNLICAAVDRKKTTETARVSSLHLHLPSLSHFLPKRSGFQ